MFDQAGIVGGEGLRKFIFLALLEQEEVERLLDLLLAFDREKILGLLRIGRDFSTRPATEPMKWLFFWVESMVSSLSSDPRMLPFMVDSFWSISMTSGFCSEEIDRWLLRWSRSWL